MKHLFALPIILLATAASAQVAQVPYPATMSQVDETAIRQVCDMARTASTINLETASSAAQYCVTLLSRLQIARAEKEKELAEATQKAKEAAKTPEPAKDQKH